MFCLVDATRAVLRLVTLTGDDGARLLEGLKRACCAFDGAASGAEATLEVAVGAWFCDVPQPAKAETTSAAMSNSLLPRRFRKVSIAVSCENSLLEVLD